MGFGLGFCWIGVTSEDDVVTSSDIEESKSMEDEKQAKLGIFQLTYDEEKIRDLGIRENVEDDEKQQKLLR